MKKSLFITIAILVIASVLCFVAFAEEEILDVETVASAETEVSAILGDEEPVYCVTVKFGNMGFTYAPVWDPDSSTYTDGTWSSTSNDIIVINKSNVDVVIDIGFNKKDDFKNITIEFAKATFKNNTWEEKEEAFGTSISQTLSKYNPQEEICSLCTFLNLSGNTDKLSTDDQSTIGTVTVTASAVE